MKPTPRKGAYRWIVMYDYAGLAEATLVRFEKVGLFYARDLWYFNDHRHPIGSNKMRVSVKPRDVYPNTRKGRRLAANKARLRNKETLAERQRQVRDIETRMACLTLLARRETYP